MKIHLRFGFYLQKIIIAIMSATFLVGCNEDVSEPQQSEILQTTIPPSTFELFNSELSNAAKEIALDYMDQISSDLNQVSIEIEQFQSSMLNFIDDIEDENFEVSKQAWLSTYNSYELTTLHRYFIAQFLEEQDKLELLQLQYQINHWPVVPGYIDYVDGYPDSGIVNDINVDLDDVSLREQHGAFDIAEVTLGFHSIEFLLWGYSNISDARPIDDYRSIEKLSSEELEQGYTLEQLSNNRRRIFLGLVTDILIEDFQALQSLWLAEAPKIKSRIEKASGTELIVMLADAMSAMLTEELLLRSLYPMLNGNFIESIQSPYSRSTQKAVSSQLSGLERLLLERQAENGTTLDLVFSAISDEFSEFFYQNFDASKSCLVLLYSNTEAGMTESSNETEAEIVKCISLLTNMIDYNNRLKFNLTN